MSAYIELCEYFRQTPTVLWDKPLLHSEFFQDSTKIQFISEADPVFLDSYEVVNLLNKRPMRLDPKLVRQWYGSTSNVVLHCNCGIHSDIWSGFIERLRMDGGDCDFGHRVPADVLFGKMSLRFRLPEICPDRQKGCGRVGFHFRVGGDQRSWSDPDLFDAEVLLGLVEKKLHVLMDMVGPDAVEIYLAGDSFEIKTEAEKIGSALGFRVLPWTRSVAHLDRTIGADASGYKAILQDIEGLGSCDFVFKTAGAFGSFAAKYSCVPCGPLADESQLVRCIEVLQTSYT